MDPRFKGLQPRMRGPIHRLVREVVIGGCALLWWVLTIALSTFDSCVVVCSVCVFGCAGVQMAKTLKHLTQRKVYTPAKIFESRKKTKAVKCALKSNDGLLFPLDNSFFFIHKPATHVRFSDIEAVEFLRYSAAGSTAQRTFDLRIALKESASAGSEVVFNSIDRYAACCLGEESAAVVQCGRGVTPGDVSIPCLLCTRAEYESLVRFLRAKNIVIMNLQQKQQVRCYLHEAFLSGHRSAPQILDRFLCLWRALVFGSLFNVTEQLVREQR